MSFFYTATAGSTATTSTWISPTSSTATTIWPTGPGLTQGPVSYIAVPQPPKTSFGLGERATLTLPDGGKLHIEADGSYRVEDANTKIIYKANRFREFNTFLNASDRVEDFIRYCGQFGVGQNELLALPLKLFIVWLIAEAAEADGMPEEEEANRLKLEFKSRARPRCGCGRFIARARAAKGASYCNGACYERYAA